MMKIIIILFSICLLSCTDSNESYIEESVEATVEARIASLVTQTPLSLSATEESSANSVTPFL